jgi:hypothetical protein
LTDATGVTIHRVGDISSWFRRVHTVSHAGELVYMDREYNINKLSLDGKRVTTLLEIPSPWIPSCLYCSPTIGDLMVGLYYNKTNTGKINMYNSTGQYILTIEQDNKNTELYKYPTYIVENKNGDIVVSDLYCGVVVTERGGRHRFSYTGPPSGSTLVPQGICTDALSHILVCDRNTHTVQMIDKDGQFLCLLLTRQHGVKKPWSLDYDVKNHLLWVGSYSTNKVSVYRYVQRKHFPTDK